MIFLTSWGFLTFLLLLLVESQVLAWANVFSLVLFFFFFPVSILLTSRPSSRLHIVIWWINQGCKSMITNGYVCLPPEVAQIHFSRCQPETQSFKIEYRNLKQFSRPKRGASWRQEIVHIQSWIRPAKDCISGHICIYLRHLSFISVCKGRFPLKNWRLKKKKKKKKTRAETRKPFLYLSTFASHS